MSAHILLFWE